MNQSKRVSFISGLKAGVLFLTVLVWSACSSDTVGVEWVSTTESNKWEGGEMLGVMPAALAGEIDVEVFTDQHLQEIKGFGACFNELGWTSLSLLSEKDRGNIMDELFTPGEGANFTICRMPVGANDFSVNWYSYNETAGDFEMKDFSIANDENTLIPFINDAKKYNSDLKIWASPWCPPTWMKYNHHYACRPDARVNDLKGDETLDLEGTNMFIQDDKYLTAYALYFGKFIDAYADKGINIYGVAPQNEFNSCQNFPSCTWTAASLTNFVGKYLGPEMEKRSIEVMMGTMERPNSALVDTMLTDPDAKKYVKSIGFQWAGKGAIEDLHKRYPEMTIYQTEQECGDGQNDWKGAVYSWNLMKHYLENGTNIYDYWNISLEKGGISRWGWAQNSLVVVDPAAKTYEYSYEYYVMKHHSHFILPGAKRVETSGSDNVMAFHNTDGSVIILVGNFENEGKEMKIKVGEKVIEPVLAANSFNTFKITKS